MEDKLLRDCATQALIRVINQTDDLVTVGLDALDIIIATCATLGAKHDVIRDLHFLQVDPLKAERIHGHYMVARSNFHRTQSVEAYMQLLEAITKQVSLVSSFEGFLKTSH